jgi:hypothetical protein
MEGAGRLGIPALTLHSAPHFDFLYCFDNLLALIPA